VEAVVERLRTRLIPAVLTALGVTFLAAGLLQYSMPVEAQPGASPTPVASVAPSPSPSDPATSPTPEPSPSGEPSPSIAPEDRVGTRVVVAALGIDLPIVKQPDPSYPSCDVAMYIEQLGQPGQGRATYLYAHAQKGMFLPILNASKVNDGKSMIGMIVEVYTSDDRLFLYEVTEVRRHQTVLTDAIKATTEQMWLQTSEGARQPPGVVGPKTQVIALLLSEGPADHADAHPAAHPRKCG
jgi:hypothetical protein